MGLDLVLPIVLLAVVLAATPLVLWLDAQGRRLELRVANVVGHQHEANANPQASPSIRLTQAGGTRIDALAYRVLRMPVDLPLANVLPPAVVFIMAIFAGFGVGVLAQIFVSLGIAVALGIAAAFGFARAVFGWELTTYQDKLLRQMPDAIELVVSATRAGLPVMEAFRAIHREMPEPTREEFRRVVNEIALGVSTDEALMNVQRRTRVTEYAIFAVTVAVQSRSGGRISESIQNLAEIVRQRMTIALRGEALSAEAKLSARIMSALPFVGGGVMSYLHPGYLTPLFTDPRGKQMFVIGISTLCVGMYLMRRLVKSVAQE